MEQVYENSYFAEELEDIRENMIPTKRFGKVFALTAGNRGQPLILVVHGSGPRNSSETYRFLLHQYLVRVSYLEKFYVVAIDCPGYGRSQVKSRQAVKTFPLQLFKEILDSLGYRSYFAMLGHSQGGSAIFHAVYEDPSITQYLVMDRPVCGNIQRFHKFSLPTLLIYDVEDDGHPIWQGKLLHKELKTSQFHSYRSSQQPYWVPDNIWSKMLGFFSKMRTKNPNNNLNESKTRGWNQRYPSVQKQKKNCSEQKRPSTSLKKCLKKRKAVSLDKGDEIKRERKKPEDEDINDRLQQVEQVDHSQLHSMIESAEEKGRIFELQQLNIPKQEQFFFGKVQIEQGNQPQSQIKQKPNKTSKQQEKKQLLDLKQKQQINNQQNEKDNTCSICHEVYFLPHQTNCHHIFCYKCITESFLVNQRCPLCRTKVTKKTKKDQLHQKILGQMDQKQIKKRTLQLQKFDKLIKSIIYVQIGNTSTEIPTKKSQFTKTKKKYAWQIFVKKPKGFELQQVLFDINMGNSNSKPTSIKSAPFAMQNKGTFSFSCQVTIKPRNRQYANLTTIYRIDVQPGQHKKIIALKKKCYSS